MLSEKELRARCVVLLEGLLKRAREAEPFAMQMVMEIQSELMIMQLMCEGGE